MTAGIYPVAKLKGRASFVFDPLAEPGLVVEAWWRASYATVDGGGRVLTIPNAGPLTRTLVRPSGSRGPLYVAGESAINPSRPAWRHDYDNTNDCRLQCTTMNMGSGSPWSAIVVGCQDIPVVGASPAQADRQQYMFDQAGRTVVWTYGGEDLIVNSGVQVVPRLKLKGAPFALALCLANGASGFVSKNSPTPDVLGDFGSAGQSGNLEVGGYRTGNANFVWSGAFSEMIIIKGALSVAKLKRVLLWISGLYPAVAITGDEAGTITRTKLNFYTAASTSADGYYFPFVSPVESMLAESGALRVKTRWEQIGPNELRGTDEAQISQSTTWWCSRTQDQRQTIHAGGTDYKTLLTHGERGQSTSNTAMDEQFVQMGGGLEPVFAWRDDPALPFVELPFASGTTIASFSPTGKMDVAGNRSVNSTIPVDSYVREIVTYRDVALPDGFKRPTYRAGALIFWGNDIADRKSAGWPARTLQRVIAGGQNSYPRPRQMGTAARTIATLRSVRSTDIDPFLVSGGLNIVVILEGLNAIGSGVAPATAAANYASLATECIAAGWTVIMLTIPANAAISDANRTTFNTAYLAAPGSGSYTADVGSITVANFILSDGYNAPTGPTAALMAAIVAPVLAARL